MAHAPTDSPTKLKWQGRWNQLIGRAKQKWGQLSNDDLDVAEGAYEELIGKIQERTGESAEEIESQLNEDEDEEP